MDFTQVKNELQFTTARSGGAGGQHVNKVETKVMIQFDVEASQGLSAEEKTLITKKLANLISKDGILSVSYERTRSQAKNKEEAIRILEEHLIKSLKKKPKRKRTRPPLSALESAKKEKQKRSAVKRSRKKPGLMD